MNFNNYTLDRFEGDYAIFLKQPEETDQLLIHRSDIDIQIEEGDIVQIFDNGERYEFKLLEDVTLDKKVSMKNLIEKLKNKE